MAEANGGIRWHWPSLLTAIFISVISGGAIQGAIAIRWAGSIDTAIVNLQNEHRFLVDTISKIDIQGSRTIPVLQERLNALDKGDDAISNRLLAVENRLDTLIRQIDQLNTPLAKKVEGMATVVDTLRDAYNSEGAAITARMETVGKRLDAVFEQLNTHGRDLAEIRNHLTILDGQMKAVRDIIEQRQTMIDRAGKAFEDIAGLTAEVRQLRENLIRIDSTFSEWRAIRSGRREKGYGARDY